VNAWPVHSFVALILALGSGSAAWGTEMVERANAQALAPDADRDWARVAARDVDAARDFIVQAHPGVLERDDMNFHAWLRDGHRAARAKADEARSREQAEAAVRYFLVGFRDPHLHVTSSQIRDRPAQWTGFNVQWQDGGYRVVHRAADPEGTLPLIGAKTVACDGVDVDTLLQERVAPFVDRRTHLEATRSALAMRLTNEWSGSHLWQILRVSSCAMETGAGDVQDFPLRWRSSDEGLRKLIHERPEQRLRPWHGGAWIHVSNFMPSDTQVDAFDRLLEEVRQAGGMKLVVLDTRGNPGGNSLLGMQILAALLKDRMPLDESQAQAYWRVSSLAIQAIERHSAALNPTSPALEATRQFVASLLREMRDAKRKGESWVRQNDIDADSMREVSGPAFRGRLVLITDAHCTSACLDFVDMVRGVPRVIHVGAATSADTRYLEGTDVRLPSGLTMMIPLKLWRGRVRGDNEPRIPPYVFRGDMRDTPAIERWLRDEVIPSVEADDPV
jgi:hypothetical protein